MLDADMHRLHIQRLLALTLLTGMAWAQQDWPTYGLTPGETRYSPLKQIDTANRVRATPRLPFNPSC